MGNDNKRLIGLKTNSSINIYKDSSYAEIHYMNGDTCNDNNDNNTNILTKVRFYCGDVDKTIITSFIYTYSIISYSLAKKPWSTKNEDQQSP